MSLCASSGAGPCITRSLHNALPQQISSDAPPSDCASWTASSWTASAYQQGGRAMCGICGEIRFDDSHASAAAVAAMCERLKPRGPDAGGLFLQNQIALGHRRLSILDLSPTSQQPMVDSELGLAIVFNGCIYNFRELRSELREKGYRFFSNGDTEVILKAYHAWGPRCVERFYGMFAFAIAERDSGRLVLVRDRLGIKPLYITQCGEVLRFASSLPALLAAGWVGKPPARHSPPAKTGSAPLCGAPRRRSRLRQRGHSWTQRGSHLAAI